MKVLLHHGQNQRFLIAVTLQLISICNYGYIAVVCCCLCVVFLLLLITVMLFTCISYSFLPSYNRQKTHEDQSQ